MTTIKTLLLTAAALGLAGAAQAQTAAPAATAAATPKVTTGATVYDTQGGQVGTIASVDGQLAVLDTGTNKVSLPLTSFAAGANGPTIAMTKAQVDAAAGGAAANAAAQTAALLTAGSKVSDSNGGAVGTIAAVDDQFVTIDTGKTKAKLPKTAFAAGPNGLVVGMTAAQIDAAAGKAAPAAKTGG